jgi:F-type H+-transporting ATPase subunit b
MILGAALFYFLRKPLAKFLENRKASVTSELAEAKSLHEEAKEMLAKYQAKLDGLEGERTKLLEEYRALGMAESDKIIAEAEQRAKQMEREADQTITQEIAAAKAALEAEVVMLATEMAEEVMRKELSATQHKGFIDGFLTDLEQSQTSVN